MNTRLVATALLLFSNAISPSFANSASRAETALRPPEPAVVQAVATQLRHQLLRDLHQRDWAVCARRNVDGQFSNPLRLGMLTQDPLGAWSTR